jgi:hypothetical protein
MQPAGSGRECIALESRAQLFEARLFDAQNRHRAEFAFSREPRRAEGERNNFIEISTGARRGHCLLISVLRQKEPYAFGYFI